eukprot:scaffold187038_cov29-Tisochrysis_lutea.AAC.6
MPEWHAKCTRTNALPASVILAKARVEPSMCRTTNYRPLAFIRCHSCGDEGTQSVRVEARAAAKESAPWPKASLGQKRTLAKSAAWLLVKSACNLR